MKIAGLVRFFNHVREQLQMGLTPDGVEPFKQTVRKTVRDVEAICRSHGVGIDRLPAPSRRAYLFLRDLNLDKLPVRQADQVVAPRQAIKPVRIKNLIKIGDYFADRIWRELDSLLSGDSERIRLLAELNQQAMNIEQICAQHQQTPAMLEAPSRRVYCWLKFLANENSLTSYLDSLGRARKIASGQAVLANRPLLLHFGNFSHLWSSRQYSNAFLLKIHIGFLNAEQPVLEALVQSALIGSENSRAHVFREFTQSEDFNEVVFEIESFAEPPAPLNRGQAHDLDESFDRVNQAYFNGAMPKPKLNWNRTLTARKLGHYQPGRDTVMISITLDDHAVPASLVDFVMYHELLHKKHGNVLVNGRRLAHTPAFRAEERQFTGYEQVELQLKELALRHLRAA